MRAGTKKGGTAFTSPASPTRAQQRAAHVPVPRVNPKAVACPECGAGVGEGCISLGERGTPKGEPVKMNHRSRKRIATRRFNEAREASRNKVELPEDSP
jgi:hypothetical protein